MLVFAFLFDQKNNSNFPSPDYFFNEINNYILVYKKNFFTKEIKCKNKIFFGKNHS